MDIEWRIWFFPTSVIHIVVDKLIPKKISYSDIGQHDSFWSILSILLISIYFYYRHNGRGEKVIDYYEKSKYNKWYNLLLLHIAFVVSYVSIFLLIIELLE